MPRGGKNYAQGGEKSLRGGGNFSRAQDSIFLPPLANFSCTPLTKYIINIINTCAPPLKNYQVGPLKELNCN